MAPEIAPIKVSLQSDEKYGEKWRQCGEGPRVPHLKSGDPETVQQLCVSKLAL